jgi:hypothetical protein
LRAWKAAATLPQGIGDAGQVEVGVVIEKRAVTERILIGGQTAAVVDEIAARGARSVGAPAAEFLGCAH